MIKKFVFFNILIYNIVDINKKGQNDNEKYNFFNFR